MGDFEIELDDQTEPDYDIDPNFAENLVDVIRSEMVGNESQFLALNAAYASGLSRRPDEYLQIIVRGKSGEGKTELKQNVDKLYPNHWLLRVGSTSDMGLVDSGDIWDGSYIGAFAEFQQMQGKMLEMVKSCVDSDHNVVTPNGLVNIRKVNVGDEVLSWNPDTQEIEVKEVEETHHYPDYDGEIMDVDTRDIALSVTDNHRVPASIGGRGGDFEELTVDEVADFSQFQFPSGKNGLKPASGGDVWTIDLHEESNVETEVDIKHLDDGTAQPVVRYAKAKHSWVPRYIDTDDFAHLCAWYITEGSAYAVPDGEIGGSNITITQGVESSYHDDISDAFDRCGLLPTTRVQEATTDKRSSRNSDLHQNKKTYRVTNTVIHDVLTSLCGLGSESKQIPEFIFDQPLSVRQSFRKELMKGDGDERDTSHRYTTVSENLRDDLIRLGFQNGITANYTTEERENENWNDCYRVRFNTDWQNVNEDHCEWRTVEDGVYCLTVEDNGSFITGRDGKFSITYNSAGDDADEDGVGFSHTRNVDDGDGGREADEIEKQAMPTVFLFADENNAEIPKELQTRQMVIRVESDKGLNKAVAKTMFDHREVRVDNRDYEYNFNFEDGVQAVKNHISNIPKPLDPLWDQDPKQYSYPVVIPYDESVEWPINSHPDIDSYGWDVFEVVQDILNYEKTESKRGAKAIANHIRGQTRLNYHNRDTMDINGVTHYVADPQDVANVLAYRDLLLAVTHDMNEQKLAVIDALTDENNGVGGVGPNGGLQAPHKDIREYIQDYADITEVSKAQLTGHGRQSNGVLEDMEQDYLIEVHENEGENGAHLYEFLGGSTFGHPNLDIYAELFEHCRDPIRDQPIAQTVSEFKDSLSVTTTDDLLSDDPIDSVVSESTEDNTDDAKDDLSAFGGGSDESTTEFDEVDEAVHERLCDTLDDNRITVEDIDALKTTHLLGASPVEMYTDDAGFNFIRAERAAENADTNGTIFDPDNPMWGDLSDGQVLSRIENSIAKLRSEDIFEIHDDGDDIKYIVVHDI
jgi:intein/homing endonuclease